MRTVRSEQRYSNPAKIFTGLFLSLLLTHPIYAASAAADLEKPASSLPQQQERTATESDVESKFGEHVSAKKHLTKEQIIEEEKGKLDSAKAISPEQLEIARRDLQKKREEWVSAGRAARAFAGNLDRRGISPEEVIATFGGSDIPYTEAELQKKNELLKQLQEAETRELKKREEKIRTSQNVQLLTEGEARKEFGPQEDALLGRVREFAKQVLGDPSAFSQIKEACKRSADLKHACSHICSDLPRGKGLLGSATMTQFLKDALHLAEHECQANQLQKDIEEFHLQLDPHIKQWNAFASNSPDNFSERQQISRLQEAIRKSSSAYVLARQGLQKTHDERKKHWISQYLKFVNIAGGLTELSDTYPSKQKD